MATTKFKGQPVKIIGEFIKVGTVAPDFELVKTDLSSFFLKDLKGEKSQEGGFQAGRSML